tara:strand:- start:311 stop:469 length:159 start_codon:yes stop_codon:yes gene_type:complete
LEKSKILTELLSCEKADEKKTKKSTTKKRNFTILLDLKIQRSKLLWNKFNEN